MKRNYRKIIVDALRGPAIKAGLSFVLSKIGWTLGGFKVWVLKLLVEYFYDSVAKPMMLLALRKGGWVYRTVEGKAQIIRLEDAKKEGDEQSYNDVVDDIFD